MVTGVRADYYDAAAEATDRKGGFYQRFVLRALSLPLSVPLMKLGVSANQATALGSLIGTLAAALACGGFFLSAAIVRHVAVVMDFVDGNLARAARRKTWAGKFFDGLSDVLLDGLFVIGVGLGLGGAHAVLALSAAWIHAAGTAARVRLLYVSAAVPRAGSAPEGHAVEQRGGVRRAVDVLERADRELVIATLIPAALFGRIDIWLVLVCGMRAADGLLNLAGSVYRGATVLNVPRG